MGGGGVVLLGILGRDLPSGSPNPDPIFRPKKCNFPHLFSDPASKIHTWLLLRLEHEQKDFLKFILNSHKLSLFPSYSFGIGTTNTFIHSCSSRENHII